MRQAEPNRPKIKTLWVHNTKYTGRMFLWDVLDALPCEIEVAELIVPLRPTLPAIVEAIVRVRALARSADVVHAQFGSMVGAIASLSSRPTVVSLRGTDFYVLPGKTVLGRIDSRVRQLLTYIGCLRSNVIIVMSKRMRREVRKWPFLNRKTIVVITDPLGEEFINVPADQRPDIKRGSPFRVFVGSLSSTNPVKRMWIIEAAVSLCNSIGVPVELKIVSGVPRQEVKESMQNSDIVALTSTHEGWPNIVKEARALGVPFIATDVSDLADLCGPGSPNRIVEPHELDVALAIVDAAARKIQGTDNSHLLPKTVGIKHELIYRYLIREG
jgi:glycosyltransferase involved in cell wall biosynthesis